MLGRVYLVGAGPGARDLITVRGLDCLRRAEVVLYDKLASEALLEEIPADAERIYVGKHGGQKTFEQEEICALLVQHARQGRRVVRLKGGDPFVFGRGGEEAEALQAEGVPFEVIPGVTSAVAVPAFAGIPVTFRGLAESFEVLTGHDARAGSGGEAKGPPRAQPVAAGVQQEHAVESTAPPTTVVLMGRRRLAENVARLRRRYRGDTPAALIQHGTLARQRSVRATLDTIEDAARDLGSPAILVVGATVELGERLAWIEARPLFGRRVMVTRARHQAAETCRLLEEQGAETVTLPTIAIRPPGDPGLLSRAVAQLATYDLLILTSANAVARLGEELHRQELDSRAFAGLTICSIGPGTAGALAELGLRADLVPEDHRAEGLLDLLPAERVAGRRVLLPRAAVAREILPRTLSQRGAAVDLVPAYVTGLPDPDQTRPGLSALEAGDVDILTFTSASTVENFASIVGERLEQLTRGRMVVAIGPITRDACERVGLGVDVMPERYTLPAMVDALVNHLKRGQQ
jgi:uroporphyrinogen III methyltransferase/synthase